MYKKSKQNLEKETVHPIEVIMLCDLGNETCIFLFKRFCALVLIHHYFLFPFMKELLV